ncbi:hypothetical protein GKO28_15160 [Deefgea sp. CFH1-16]|nr:hypothetical protein [Deefgea sp. CFH1-16]
MGDVFACGYLTDNAWRKIHWYFLVLGNQSTLTPLISYADQQHQKYMEGKMTKEEFINEYRDPKNYRPELPSSNRSDNKRPER